VSDEQDRLRRNSQTIKDLQDRQKLPISKTKTW